MRSTWALWSRAIARPRRGAANFGRKWSRETAKVLDLVLRNRAPLPWQSLPKFAQMPPNTEDVLPLLPMLEQRALEELRLGQSEGLQVLGDFAFSLGLVAKLGVPFLTAWVSELSKSNVFRALQIFKTTKSLPLHLGVDLYLRAGQPHKASKLAQELQFITPQLRRKFVYAFLNAGELDSVQLWINEWQAMQPEDVRWLHHLVNQRNIHLQLPPLPEATSVTGRHVRIGEGLQHLVSKLNGILALAPDLLAEPEVYTAWMDSIANPSRESLERLCIIIADKAPIADWLPVLRLVSAPTGREILQRFPQLPPRAYAVVIARSPAADVPKILELMEPETFYTAECLHAVAQTSPALFAEMTVPQTFLETELRDHHLIALWSVYPELDWLFPLTLQFRSPRLLRSAVKALVKKKDPKLVNELLTDFVVHKGLALNPKVLESRGKLGDAEPHNLGREAGERIVSDAMATLFK